MVRRPTLLLACALVSAAACGSSRTEPAAGLSLPPGDATRGKALFVELQCNACHDVAGGGLPAPSTVPAVALGGRMLLPPSEKEIAGDILMPSSHLALGYPASQITQDGRSRMPDYGQKITFQQAADLAAFLKSRYQRGVPTGTR